MRRALRALDGALFAPVAAAPWGAARALLGAALLLAWGSTLPSFEALYGDGGAAGWLSPGPARRWTADALLPLGAGLVIGSLGLCLGAFTRASALLLALCHTALIREFHAWTWGWGTVTPLFVLLIGLGGGGRALSVDAWRAGGRRPGAAWGPAVLPGWAPRLMWLHLACIYLAAAWHRFDDEAWLQGHILWEALTASVFSRWSALDLHPFKPALWVLSYLAWGVELAATVLLLVPRARPWMGLLCFALHAGLELSTSVGWWQWVMCACLVSTAPGRPAEAALARAFGPRPD
jgi:hypothetical protein